MRDDLKVMASACREISDMVEAADKHNARFVWRD